MRQHVHYDFLAAGRGDVITVSLDQQANVFLLDDVNYRSYKSGGRCEYVGGRAIRSPVRFSVPRDGNWYVAIDLAGIGRIRSGATIMRRG
jgi:hypothetical protein